jgi:hypothetical protein
MSSRAVRNTQKMDINQSARDQLKLDTHTHNKKSLEDTIALARLGRSQFKISLGKKLARFHLNQ